MERDLLQRAANVLREHLDAEITVTAGPHTLQFRHNAQLAEFRMIMPGEGQFSSLTHNLMPLDYVLFAPAKVAALVRSRLGLNKRVFARNCEVKPVNRKAAAAFLDRYHLMNSATSAWNLGLTYKEELLCVAAFSKGRKMRRLHEYERSYELIRFCCRDGVTVTGGLSKIVKTFCRQRSAAEIMTYVDRQFSDGKSFVAAGFRVSEITPPMPFVVDSETYKRSLASPDEVTSDNVIWNAGNVKMLYRCP